MLPNFKNRSTEKELMDDFSMDDSVLYRSLDTLAAINQWLGGNQLTMKAVKTLLKEIPPSRELTIVDLGCGNGDMLRRIAEVARKHHRKVKLIGIDANEFTVNYARKKSTAYQEISYLHQTIPSADFNALTYDMVLCTLFLHHFTDAEILNLLTHICAKAEVGVVINDLHRSRWAYILFNLLTLFIPNPMIRQDGLISISKGFKKTELQNFAHQLQVPNSRIQWKWAFRYQWVIRR